MNNLYRIGLVVPSSNTTMETEIPKLLRAREEISPERFTFHSSRTRMHSVNLTELKTMNDNATKCIYELMDASVDVMAYACLVAVMSEGQGFHEVIQKRFKQITEGNPAKITQIVSSAGALLEALQVLGAKKIAFLCPYSDELTKIVINYFNAEGIEVIAHHNFNVTNNLAVSRLDPANLITEAKKLNYKEADVVVLSACVQMPSLDAVALAEKELGKPVISASIATTYKILKALGLATNIPNGGTLLSGAY